jgi:opacity protein-like surface antigen
MSARITIRRSSPLHNQLCRDVRAANLMTTAAFVLVILPTAARAADMSMKAPVTPIYGWSGCYVGINAGAAGAGSDFTSTVGNGTHLLSADAALVSNSGTGSADATGFLGGGQAGCNWQSGLIVYGLEGDFDYFHSQPSFSNNTNTLSDGVTPFAGEPQGRGVLILQGVRYEGEFRSGKPNGAGTLIRAGESFRGTWIDGCFREGTRKASFGVPLSACP